MTRLRAITLWQPYAQLIALGVKRIETRSWPAPADAIGQRLVIHAAARVPSHSLDLAAHDDFRVHMIGGRYLLKHPLLPEDRGIYDLPLGAVVASATLTACVPMIEMPHMMNEWPSGRWLGVARQPDSDIRLIDATRAPENVDLPGPGHGDGWSNVSDQEPYGDFAPGRWAWLLDDIKPTTERCPSCWSESLPCDGLDQGGCSRVSGHDGPHLGVDGCAELDLPLSAGFCRVCRDAGDCEPVPAKGYQRLWWWEP